jgi:hypothetical protein
MCQTVHGTKPVGVYKYRCTSIMFTYAIPDFTEIVLPDGGILQSTHAYMKIPQLCSVT